MLRRTEDRYEFGRFRGDVRCWAFRDFGIRNVVDDRPILRFEGVLSEPTNPFRIEIVREVLRAITPDKVPLPLAGFAVEPFILRPATPAKVVGRSQFFASSTERLIPR